MVYDEKADFNWHKHEVEIMAEVWRRFGVEIGPCRTLLDLGGGSGMHAPFLAPLCEHYIIVDKMDYYFKDQGKFLARVYEKFCRHRLDADLAKIQFHNGDAEHLLYRDQYFDSVVSFNAFEHIRNPENAFVEVARVVRPGGTVFIQFDPIWTSLHGSHFGHYIDHEPWGHLFYTQADFLEMMSSKGASMRDLIEFEQGINKKSFYHYKTFFELLGKMYFDKYSMEWWPSSEEDEPRTNHPNFEKLRAQGYGVEDLVVRGFRFLGVRR